MSRINRRPAEGWFRFAARQLFLGGLGLTGNELLPAGGWLRWAAVAFYVVLAVVVVAIAALVMTQS